MTANGPGTPALEVAGFTKRFGDTLALDDVSLTVPEGSIYGFLGPNGAGKTTTLRIVTGLASADQGSARIFGHAPGSREARASTGFLPDVPGFYNWMTAEEFLRFVAGLFELDAAKTQERVSVLLDLAGLTDVRTKIGGYSRGMKQRLGVAQALMNAPRLLMLDEPTSALDPLGRKEVLDMIASLAGRTTVFFSTHILADVERVCDRVAILNKGRVVAESGIDELKSHYSAHRLDIEIEGDAVSLADTLRAEDWVTSMSVDPDGCIHLAAKDVAHARVRIPELVVAAGVGLRRFDSGEISLEEVFVDIVGGGDGR